MAQEELNGYPQLDEIRPDPTVQALRAQISPLQEAHQLFSQALELSDKVLRSLQAIAPALDMQIHGLNSENEQLQNATSDVENTYAGIVEKLENQMKSLRNKYSEEKQRNEEDYQAEIQRLQHTNLLLRKELNKALTELKSFQNQFDQKEEVEDSRMEIESPSKSNPYSDLNIFGI